MKKIGTLKIAGAYIGTVVGAGFASGQEVLQFFAIFGTNGLWGLAAATVLFMLFGYISMELGRALGAESHLKIVRYAGGKYIGALVDYIITFFLFGALTTMIASSGAMVRQQFGISPVWGNIIMTAAAVITVLSGIRGVINSISVVVPLLLSSAIGVSLVTLFFMPQGGPPVKSLAVSSNGLVQNWRWAAVLYVSYNMVLAIPVLGALGNNGAGAKAVRNGAILGGLGLGLGAAAIHLAMVKNLENVKFLEIPMAAIAGRISSAVQAIYIAVLLAEVYTTAVGSLYGFAARVAGDDAKKSRPVIVVTAIAAFVASRFGFSNLVRYLYPIVGYAGIVMLVILIYAKFKSRGQRANTAR